MAHEIENMFYLNAAPWHGLGKKLIELPSVEEAIKHAGLDWQVGLKPLFTAEQESVPALATYRMTDNKILGVVGPTYKPLQNVEAFKFFNPFIQSKEAIFETAGSLRGGQRVWILAKVNRDPMEIVKGDAVEKFILLSNSHDGTLAVRVGFTPVRVVCANTLAMAHGDGASKLIRIRHVGDVSANLDKVREIMDAADQQFKATAEQYKLLATKQINQADLKKFVKVIFSQPTQIEDTAGDRVLAKIIPLFEKGRGNDMPGVKGTYWAAYNAVTEYLQHERGKEAEGRLDSTWFGQGASLNRKALDTAVTMIKLAA